MPEVRRGTRLERGMERLSRAAGIAVAIVGGLVLLGWARHAPVLTAVLSDAVAMKPNTALALLLAGAALALQRRREWPAIVVRRVAAAATSAIGALALFEHAAGVDLGIDELLAYDTAAAGAPPGRMGIVSAANLAVIGAALLLVDLPVRRGRWTAQALVLAMAPTALLPILGYAYDVKALVAVGGSSAVAVHAAVSLALLQLGVLLARPDRGFMAGVSAEGAGSTLARRAIAYAVAVPLVLGGAAAAGFRRGFVDPVFAIALLVLVIIVLLAALLWRDAMVVNRMEQQRELARRSREVALDRLAAALTGEQEARARAEAASRTKDQFLATLSHELRTPLNAILGWARLLRDRGGDRAFTLRGLEAIERNARSQTQLVGDLLDTSRIISGRVRLDLREVDMARVVDVAVESVLPGAAAKAIRVERHLERQPGKVDGDAGRLEQVVWNLLSNAVKFTPEGGVVEVRLARDGGSVVISVHDTGVGIPPLFLPSVFDRFTQADGTTSRKHGGLGLGLAISRHLAELHGGTLEAASPGEGQGATFTLRLPAKARPTSPAPELATRRPADLAGVSVLVVDDEPDAREVLAELLALRHASVAVASSAAEALASIERTRPDVLVSDIAMPGEDGYALIDKVRRLEASRGGPGLPAIALSALARDEDRERTISAGFQMHVTKPVEADVLVAAIARLAGRPAVPAAAAAQA